MVWSISPTLFASPSLPLNQLTIFFPLVALLLSLIGWTSFLHMFTASVKITAYCLFCDMQSFSHAIFNKCPHVQSPYQAVYPGLTLFFLFVTKEISRQEGKSWNHMQWQSVAFDTQEKWQNHCKALTDILSLTRLVKADHY